MYQFALVRKSESVKSSQSINALTLGLTPGPLLISALECTKESLTSRIAVRIGTDALVEKSADEVTSNATTIVRQALKEANSRVYEYSHRMGAGGKMGASGLVAVFDGSSFTVGKVGAYLGYAWRSNEFVSLFKDERSEQSGVLDRFLGANVQVLVDLATVPTQPGDICLITNVLLSLDTQQDITAGIRAKISSRGLCNLVVESEESSQTRSPAFAVVVALAS